MVAEFEADLIRARTREGMKVAKAKGRLRGKQPKLSPTQEAHLVELYRGGEHTVSELEELFARHPLDRLPGHPARRQRGQGAVGRRRVARRRRRQNGLICGQCRTSRVAGVLVGASR